MIRSLLAFDSVELELSSGLTVLTGPSGAGKSVLVSAILSNFGHSRSEVADVCEVAIRRPKALRCDGFELEEEMVIKSIKKERVRYFLDFQQISKKMLKECFAPYVQHLSVTDAAKIDSHALIQMIDTVLTQKDTAFKKELKEYKKRYEELVKKESKLHRLKRDRAEIEESLEFARFEVQKIASIDPKEDELEELLEKKRQLSQMEKLKQSAQDLEGVFEMQSRIDNYYELSGKHNEHFSLAFDKLQIDLSDTEELMHDLEQMHIESMLDRISDLSELERRYGSIRDAIEYRAKKEHYIESYSNSDEKIKALEEFVQLESSALYLLAKRISQKREHEAKAAEDVAKGYLKELKLPSLKMEFHEQKLGRYGIDEIIIDLEGKSVKNLSGGEFNRFRLSVLASFLPKNSNKLIILDEIDANVSGDESIAIAKIIKEISKSYQVFAISHQPHLSAAAHMHILVEKRDEKSKAVVLKKPERIKEIARIIAGDDAHAEALEFAKKLLESTCNK